MDKLIIKNKSKLSTTSSREKVLEILEAGIKRVLASKVIENSVKYDFKNKILKIKDKKYSLRKGRIFIIGGGKASGLMAEKLETIIGPENITEGIINCNTANYSTTKIKIIKASHPFPGQKGVAGVHDMLELKIKYSINKNDLILCLISGGGSALMPCPVKGVTLEDKQKITNLLLESGAKIHEVNAVRKHLSLVKGGQIGKYFSPAKVVSLILSDVIGNNFDVIASGPTAPDNSTFKNALKVLKKYNLILTTPVSVVKYLKKGLNETPKRLNNCQNFIIGENKIALEAMFHKAKELGYSPIIVTCKQQGNPMLAAEKRAKEIIKGRYKDYNLVLLGGETTPKLPPNHGKGGRNQQYALASLQEFKDYKKDWTMASIGTDGVDFLDGVAGAIVDHRSINEAKKKRLNINEYLQNYDSNTFFRKLKKSLIKAKNTGTNVGDIMIYAL